MYKIEMSVVVHADRDTLNTLMTTPDKIVEWYVGADEMTASDNYPAVGSTLTSTLKILTFALKSKLTVVEYDPGTAVRYTVDGMIKGTFDWFLEDADDGGTKVRHRVEYDLVGGAVGKLAAPMVHRQNVSNSKDSLKNLKRMAEA